MKKRNIFSTTVVVVIISLILTAPVTAQHDWTEQITALKPMVVNIESAREVVFEREEQSVGFATGFIVDAKRGIIATNAHVTGSGPSFVKINFYDGSFTEAKTLYYDPVHDFGFFRIDPQSLPFKLQEADLGKWKSLKVGDDVLMIGNNEKEEYSIKFGAVANLNIDKGDIYSSYIHTTFDRTGGSSGSPVLNTRGQVVGIHASGSDTSSFELPIDYLADALAKLRAGIPIRRGGLGVDLRLISTGEAGRHFGLPDAIRKRSVDPAEGIPKVIQVESVLPQSSAEGKLLAGDILHRLNGRVLKDDLYMLDCMLNENVGESVTVDVFRNGAAVEVAVPVEDLEAAKIRRFVRFGGGIFHDITAKMRWYHDYDGQGVYLPFSDEGSSFSRVGYRIEENGKMAVVVTEISGNPIRNLEDFVTACLKIGDGTHTYLLRNDLFRFKQSLEPVTLSLNLAFGPLKVFEWDEQSLEWRKLELFHQ